MQDSSIGGMRCCVVRLKVQALKRNKVSAAFSVESWSRADEGYSFVAEAHGVLRAEHGKHGCSLTQPWPPVGKQNPSAGLGAAAKDTKQDTQQNVCSARRSRQKARCLQGPRNQRTPGA